MIKLLPNEQKHCEWAGITITSSRIFIQAITDGDNFSVRQFPAEDYRGIQAVFHHKKTFKLLAMALLLASIAVLGVCAFMENPHSLAAVVQEPQRPILNPSIYELNGNIALLVGQKNQLEEAKSFVFFRKTQIMNLEKKISEETEKANRMIATMKEKAERENAAITVNNNRRLTERSAAIRDFQAQQARIFLIFVMGLFLSFASLGLYFRSGRTTVVIDFDITKVPVPVSVEISGGKRQLKEALEFVSQVDNFLSPLSEKRRRIA